MSYRKHMGGTWLVMPVGLAVACAALLVAAGRPLAAVLALTGSTAAALIAALACASAAWRGSGRARHGWSLMAIGCGSWCLGNAYWTWNELVRHTAGLFPSAADVGFLVFPVAAAAGIWLISGRSPGSRLTAVLDGMVIAAALFLILWAVSLRTMATAQTHDRFAFAVSLAYPFGDILIATMGCALAARIRRGSRAVVMALVVGSLAMATADVLFAVATAHGSYQSGSWPDYGWVTAFLAITLAARLARRRPVAANAADRAERWQILVPYVPFAISIAMGAASAIAGRKPDPPEVVAILLVFVCLLVRQLVAVLSHSALSDRLRHEASHDALTGLANRSHFIACLDRTIAARHLGDPPIGVLYVNLDNLTLVNDTVGHHVGDHLLRAIADRLRHLVPDSAVVARLSGDEFAVMVTDRHDIESLARDVAAAVRQPLTLGPHTIAVTASISIATTPTAEGALVSGSELRQQVDLAMQDAKERGKDTIRRFESSMRERLDTEMMLRAELDKALRHGALHVVYQPIVRLPSHRPAGVEALARWRHPTLGDVSPADFIAVAERAGLIHSLGLFVLNRACEEFAAWDLDRTMYLSVNVSTLQLLDPGFPDRVAAVLQAHSVDARRIVLEMTETVLVEESQVSSALHALRSKGVRIAVDDFGTGYASLRYLRCLPIDVVKIDRSYVTGLLHDPTAKHFISSLTQLFHGLGLAVVAEGVEQEGQSNELAVLGVDLGQGYLYGKPVPAQMLPAPVPALAATTDMN